MNDTTTHAPPSETPENRGRTLALVVLAALIAGGLITLLLLAPSLAPDVELEVRKAGLIVTILGGLGFLLVLFRVFLTSFARLVSLFVALALMLVAVELAFVGSTPETNLPASVNPDTVEVFNDAGIAPDYYEEVLDTRLGALEADVKALGSTNRTVIGYLDSLAAGMEATQAVEMDPSANALLQQSTTLVNEMRRLRQDMAEIRQDVAELGHEVRELSMQR